MELILKYFPNLTQTQKDQFMALEPLYKEWNENINVISRKDIDQLYLRHILHSLAIARVCEFGSGARILDVGCGGGLPGIPLAILFPEARFTLVDSIGKKIKVVEAVASAIGLANLSAHHQRAEETKGQFDFIVSRAVTEMKLFVSWTWGKIERSDKAATLSNGILCLKGGDLTAELSSVRKPYSTFNISDFFEEDFFETKQVVYLPK